MCWWINVVKEPSIPPSSLRQQAIESEPVRLTRPSGRKQIFQQATLDGLVRNELRASMYAQGRYSAGIELKLGG